MDEAAFSKKLSMDEATEEKKVARRQEEQEQQQLPPEPAAAALKVETIDGEEFDGVAVEFEESDDDEEDDEYDEEFMEVDSDSEEDDGVAVEFEESESEEEDESVKEFMARPAPDLKASGGEEERHVTCTAPTAERVKTMSVESGRTII